MRRWSSPSTIILLIAMWLLVTVAVALWAASSVARQDSVDVTAPLPPIDVSQRATTSLADQTIASVVSANGSVIPGEEGSWILSAPVASDDLAYRLLDPPLGVKAMINGGPSGFDCAWIGLAVAGGADLGLSATGLDPQTTGVTMQCQIPDDIRVVAGLRGKMVLRMTEPSTVPSLPRSAVVGDANQGQVIVVQGDGTLEARVVQLGVADTYHVAITGGLTSDELVMLSPTQADFTQAANTPP